MRPGINRVKEFICYMISEKNTAENIQGVTNGPQYKSLYYTGRHIPSANKLTKKWVTQGTLVS